MNRAHLAVFLFLSASFFSCIPIVHAQSAADLQSQIDANNKQLDALKTEIAVFQQQLDALGTKKDTLESTISSLSVSQKQLAAQIQATQNKIQSANLQIRQFTLSIGDKEERIAADQDAVTKSLRTIAENERSSLIVRLVSVDSFDNAWRTVDETMQFNRALTKDINDLRAVRIQLASNRDAVTTAKANLVSLQNELSLQKKSVDLNKAAQQKLLVDTKNQESIYQKLLADKQAEELRFETALFELASKLEFVLDPSRIPPAGKGVLRWPLDKIFVTQQFGRTSSSGRLYTDGTHDGIDFRTKWPLEYPTGIGMPVRAALSGTVLEVNYGAAQNCQYGKWVLIKHPNGLATLYAHLSDIAVQKNSVVVTGQVIGFSGNSGYATGPHLHFGVYFVEAVSFRQYVCKNGQRVTIPIAPVNAYLDPLSYL